MSEENSVFGLLYQVFSDEGSGEQQRLTSVGPHLVHQDQSSQAGDRCPQNPGQLLTGAAVPGMARLRTYPFHLYPLVVDGLITILFFTPSGQWVSRATVVSGS